MEEAPELFPPGQSVGDYDIDRLLWRGSDSQVKVLGVSLDDISGIATLVVKGGKGTREETHTEHEQQLCRC